jgi:hypothetical protein
MPLDASSAPQAGYAKLGALFRAAHVTLGDHVDFVDRLGTERLILSRKPSMGLDPFNLVPQLGQLSKMVTDLSFAPIFLTVAYLLLIRNAIA